ncbi:uncharacterized protein [Garra rufa]
MRHMRNENRTNDTDLQWRHGCVVKPHSNGSVICLQGTDEYGYDGENLTFDLSMHWKPVVLENGVIWNRESVSSLERNCVETLNNFTGLPQKGRFIMKCFYPKRVQMEITRSWSPLPDEQLNSSGIRPNADGCFHLMKSLEILLSDSSHYNCVVNGSILPETTFTNFTDYDEEVSLRKSSPYWGWQWVTDVVILIVVFIIVLTVYRLIKCVKHPEKQKTPKTPSQVKLSSPETHACLATALNDSSDEENTADDSMVKVQTEELHETQSLCDAKVTPAAAPTAARGEMGSKNCSLPNFAIEKEDTHENSVTQNALQLALIQRCRFKNISMPSLALKRKDTSDSS